MHCTAHPERVQSTLVIDTVKMCSTSQNVHTQEFNVFIVGFWYILNCVMYIWLWAQRMTVQYTKNICLKCFLSISFLKLFKREYATRKNMRKQKKTTIQIFKSHEFWGKNMRWLLLYTLLLWDNLTGRFRLLCLLTPWFDPTTTSIAMNWFRICLWIWRKNWWIWNGKKEIKNLCWFCLPLTVIFKCFKWFFIGWNWISKASCQNAFFEWKILAEIDKEL